MGKGGFSKGSKGKGKEETDLQAIAAAAASAAVQQHLWWQEDTWQNHDAMGADDVAAPAAGSNAWAGASTDTVFHQASMEPIYKHVRICIFLQLLVHDILK